MKWIEAPHPKEGKLLLMIDRQLTMPSGRVMNVTMSQWHWDILEYLQERNFAKHGDDLFTVWCERFSNKTDKDISNIMMLRIRDVYEKSRKRRFVGSSKADDANAIRTDASDPS